MPALRISGYAEAYYSYDLNRPGSNTRPGFLYSYNRHNEVNLNLGFVKAAYAKDRVRANLALGAGTYMNANYAAEPGTLQHLLEANVGYRLSAKRQLWLDLGVLPSHIGFESAIGKDNWTLTRSLVAENSPYFESGARLSYATDNGKWSMAALALNGWQRITRVTNNSLMSYGAQLTFKPSSSLTVNYSGFAGTDQPDSNRLWRYYHNVYVIGQVSPRFGITAGFDLGMQQSGKNSDHLNNWYTPVLILRYQPVAQWSVAARGEYFSDPDQTLIGTGTLNGFRTSGLSLNIDYSPVQNMLLRAEGRYLHSRDEIFQKNDQPRDNNTALTFSMAVAF